ncbi:porin family protein [Vibrio metschnikovii]|uniref:Outer membrane beta-barrel protein n=3 Tax=Bacteria TaxID=2 RepID=A0AAU6USM9_UNCXX|nr:porin family protein [Vibrio metschnikovii]EKO3592079.1 porin family protein [Vibrio metschnikovii]EKO3605859.1 porin family protein [Vibrio metschnikovii]EKO3609144.1 porin family protein [Vibrio metschnikovii]EKO3642693.1 porin family protein [Vibrio metschnikovii]
MYKKIAISLTLLSTNVFSNEIDNDYYGAIRGAKVIQSSDGMNLSHRPGIGEFVSGDDKSRFYDFSLALGKRYSNHWRTEAEYSFKKTSEYTSGSSVFTTSFNHHKVQSERLMFNMYRDFKLKDRISAYGMIGFGLAKVKSSGWQGNENRQYEQNTDTNIAYSLGAGVSYQLVENVSFDLGYRYVDLGEVESGWNKFQNARGLQDEKMKANLKSSEYYLGVRVNF